MHFWVVVTKSWNDLQWPTMIYYDLHWPTMIYIDLLWPLSWGRTKLKFGTDINQVTMTSLDSMNRHHCHVTSYQTLLKKSTFLRSDKAEIWYRHKPSDDDQHGRYELLPLCHVTSYQTLFKKSTLLRSDKAEIWYRQKSSEGDQFGCYELSPLCHVTSYQTLF